MAVVSAADGSPVGESAVEEIVVAGTVAGVIAVEAGVSRAARAVGIRGWIRCVSGLHLAVLGRGSAGDEVVDLSASAGSAVEPFILPGESLSKYRRGEHGVAGETDAAKACWVDDGCEAFD